MSSSARIDELRRKFDENPRRFFAPLANEHRKAGDLEQAIALCRAHLPHQAGHISGHIVLAQALNDAGEHEEARYVFHQALELDPENLIALRCLGDLARERGDLADAGHWYQRVLEVDPRNEEMSQLARQVESERLAARASRKPTPHMSTVAIESVASPVEEFAPPVVPAAPPRSATPVSMAELDDRFGAPIDTAFESSFDRPVETPADPASEEWRGIASGAGLESLDVPPDLDISALGMPAEPSLDSSDASVSGPIDGDAGEHGADDPFWGDERASAAEHAEERSPAVTSGPDRHELDLGDLEAAADPFYDDWLPALDHGAMSGGVDPHAPIDAASEPAIAEGVEPASADETEPTLEFEELALEVATQSDAHEAAVPAPESPTDDVDPFMGRALSEAPIADATPAAFVTETMAELYLQQGFEDEALEVYRQLLAQRPDDAILRDRIEMLEASRPEAEPLAEIEPSDDAEELPAEATVDAAVSLIPAQPFEAAVGATSIEMVEPSASVETPEPVHDVAAAHGATGGPTAREFLAALATRRPGESSGAVASVDDGGAGEVETDHAVVAASVAEGNDAPDPLEEEEDIDAFNAWLEGLRKP